MAVCKDCIHFCVCSPYTAPNESYPEVDGCKCFRPTADVVPRSEVDQWYHEYHVIKDELKQEKMYHKETEKLADKYCAELQTAKTEVVREIFDEIEQEILSAIDNNLKRMAEQDSANEIWRMCVSKKNTLCGIYDFIAELKKKYTEENKDDNQN